MKRPRIVWLIIMAVLLVAAAVGVLSYPAAYLAFFDVAYENPLLVFIGFVIVFLAAGFLYSLITRKGLSMLETDSPHDLANRGDTDVVSPFNFPEPKNPLAASWDGIKYSATG